MSAVEERLAAARTIGRVLRSGAWANVALRVEAEDSASVPAVQALVMGLLRHVPWIDHQISRAAGREIDALDPPILDLLRVGAHEIREGARPVPVVVDTLVSAAKQTTPRAAGFVNAVMRRIAENEPPEAGFSDLGFRQWLVESLERTLGPDTGSFLRASNQPAATGVRSKSGFPGAEPVPGIAGAWLWSRSEGPLPPGVAIQDPASVAVGLAVDAAPGHRVLDVAAAPGGKTGHLLDLTGAEGTVVAADRHRRRVRDAARRHPGALWVTADGTRPCVADESFDRVLLDAPCTGLGTLRRRPEIRYRVSPEEIERLARLQRDLLQASVRLVRPGGRLVYSVCTVTPDETIDVVAGLGGRPPDDLPGVPVGDGLVMGPHLGATDGMFICVFDR